VITEFVRGAGEGLVSGVTDGIRIASGGAFHGVTAEGAAGKRGGAEGAEVRAVAETSVMEEVTEAVRALGQWAGAPVDVEWVWDGRRLHVVQVRPVVAAAPPAASPITGLAMADMYADPLPNNIYIGQCQSIRDHFLVKRGWVRVAAERAGFATGAAWVVNVTHDGLVTDGAEMQRRLDATPAAHVVIDLGAAVRQVVLAKQEVLAYLRDSIPRDRARHVMLIRDFYGADGGAICALAGRPDRLLVEYSEAGLLALNRGTAGARAFLLGGDRPDDNLETGPAGLARVCPPLSRVWPRMLALTRDLDGQVPGVQLEWAVEGGHVVLVDYSVPAAPLTAEFPCDASVPSPGYASGPAVLVDDAFLADLSIGAAVSVKNAVDLEHSTIADVLNRLRRHPSPPVLVASRPYAVLSVFIDHVAGFVFRKGSLFSHLSLLLRERRCPAVISDLPMASGDRVSFSNGGISVHASAGRAALERGEVPC
jgi:hypothetical protein